MDTAYLDTLKKRASELRKELEYIESILKLYPTDSNTLTKTKLVSTKGSRSANKMTKKDEFMKLISELGGKVYVSDVVKELQKNYPSKDKVAINNQVRNYLYILKNEGKLRAEMKKNNKFQYIIT